MKASINIITTALLTLLSAIGATAAEPNPSAGTRVDYREVLLFDFSDWRIETEPH